MKKGEKGKKEWILTQQQVALITHTFTLGGLASKEAHVLERQSWGGRGMLLQGRGSQTPSLGWKGHPTRNPSPVSLAKLLTKKANSHGSYLHTFAKHRLPQALGQEKRWQQRFKSYFHSTDHMQKGRKVFFGLQLSRKPRAAAMRKQQPVPAHLQQSSVQSKKISTGETTPEHPEPAGLLRARSPFSSRTGTYISAFVSQLQRTGRID